MTIVIDTIMKVLPAMLGVGALFVLFAYLRPGEACGGHCRMCGSGCATKGVQHHE
jgi:hypothetical protein